MPAFVRNKAYTRILLDLSRDEEQWGDDSGSSRRTIHSHLMEHARVLEPADISGAFLRVMASSPVLADDDRFLLQTLLEVGGNIGGAVNAQYSENLPSTNLTLLHDAFAYANVEVAQLLMDNGAGDIAYKENPRDSLGLFRKDVTDEERAKLDYLANWLDVNAGKAAKRKPGP